jgi:hypothetical protein
MGLAGAAWDILALFGGYSLSTEQSQHIDQIRRYYLSVRAVIWVSTMSNAKCLIFWE